VAEGQYLNIHRLFQQRAALGLKVLVDIEHGCSIEEAARFLCRAGTRSGEAIRWRVPNRYLHA
jgi:hypothetical protein